MSVRILTADGDSQDRNEVVVIYRGGRYYIATVPEDGNTAGKEVLLFAPDIRSNVPGLQAVAKNLFEVLANAPNQEGITKKGI